MSDIPASGAHWVEPRVAASAGTGAFTRLTPYLLTDGSVEFLLPTDSVPGGAIAASVQDSGDGTDEIITPAVSTGRRPVEVAGNLILL